MASRILRNFSFLTIGKTLGDAFTFLLFVVLSRTFGQEGIGQYSFAMALTGFFVVFADFGLYNLSIKEMSRRHGSVGEYYGGILLLRLLLSIVVLAALLFGLSLLSFPSETRQIIALIGVYQIIYTLMDGFAAVFIAREEMHIAGLLEFSLRAVTALVGIAVALSTANLVMVLVTLPVLTSGQVLVAYRLVSKKYGRPKLSGSWSYLSRTLREAIPYGLSMFLRQLSTRVDVVFLGFFLGATAAGVYNVAYRVVFLLMFLPHFAAMALFPMASRLYVSSPKELEALYHKSLNLVILVGLPATCGLGLIAPDLINFTFGEAFAESSIILRCLAWLLFLSCPKSIMGIFLTSCDRQAERTRSQWTSAWVNVLGNGLLIPTIGVNGAAIATVISETLLVILLAMRIKAFLGWPQVGSRLVMSAVATATFCLPLAFFSSIPLWVAIPASMLLYSGSLVSFKEIRMNEVRTLMDLLRRT
jgi:O-antigen/teichoic acid export membrane protein